MRLVTTITSLVGIAAIAFVFAGHAFAGQSTINTAASSSFGSSHTQKVHVQPIERWLGGGGRLKKVPCPVTGTLTVCYASR